MKYHSDGSVWAKGQHRAGKATGYWEWFRKDGTKMRSGYFERDEQVGEWTTYDQKGAVYKVTVMKPKAASKSAGDNRQTPFLGGKIQTPNPKRQRNSKAGQIPKKRIG